MRRWGVALCLTLALAGCTRESATVAEPTVTPPAWEALGDAGLPPAFFADIAGGDVGFVLIIQPRETFGSTVLTSKDGREWTENPPPGMRDADLAVADDGHRVHLTSRGGDDHEQLIWEYLGGSAWSAPISLRGAVPAEDFMLDGSYWALDARDGEVYAAHVDEDLRAIELWSSVDGFVPTEAVVLPEVEPRSTFSHLALNAVAAPWGTALLHRSATSRLRLSVVPGDRVGLVEQIPATTIVTGLAVNGDDLALFGDVVGWLEPGDPGYVEGDDGTFNEIAEGRAWCGGTELAPATVDPGRLPDLGVGDSFVNTVIPFGGGFMLLGGTVSDNHSRGVGGLWTSPDGCAWTKDAVAANGFDDADALLGGAVGGGVTVVVGEDTTAYELRIWRG